MQNILAIVTVVVVGVMVGVEFAVAVFVNPILDRLPDDYGLTARSDGARILGKVMPVWYIGAVVLSATWAALAWGGTAAGAAAGLVSAATALLILSVLMSIALLVPIASRSAQWTREDHPADWKQQVGRWDRYHYARVGVIIAAFVLLVVGIA